VILGNEKLSELSKKMTLIGDDWREFALEASRIYKQRGGETRSFDAVADMLDDLGKREEVFFKELRNAIRA
jgi:hypothetical protein